MPLYALVRMGMKSYIKEDEEDRSLGKILPDERRGKEMYKEGIKDSSQRKMEGSTALTGCMGGIRDDKKDLCGLSKFSDGFLEWLKLLVFF